MGHAARLFNGSAGQTLYGRVTPSPEQLAFLREHACDEAQGYLISRPVPEPEFRQMLARPWTH